MAAEEGKVDPMKQFAIEPMFGTGGFEVAGYNLAFTYSALWMLIATVLLCGRRHEASARAGPLADGG